MEPRYWKNLNVILPCMVVLSIMFGLVAYSPQLYRIFCGATGYGGTTQRAYSDPTTISERTVTVAFDSNGLRPLGTDVAAAAARIAASRKGRS